MKKPVRHKYVRLVTIETDQKQTSAQITKLIKEELLVVPGVMKVGVRNVDTD